MGSQNRTVSHVPQPLTKQDADALFKAVDQHTSLEAGIRNKALFVLYYRCALRCNEALRIMPEDLRLDNNSIHVRAGKGYNGKPRPRTVAIDYKAAIYVRDWVDMRADMNPPPGTPLFFNVSKLQLFRPMTTKGMRKWIDKLKRRAGVTCRVHLHGLRHTAAFDMATESVGLLYIQKQLGHSKLTMTERYISHLQPQQLVDTLKIRSEW